MLVGILASGGIISPMKTNQKGFAGIVALIVIIVAIIAGGAYVTVKQNTQVSAPTTNLEAELPSDQSTPATGLNFVKPETMVPVSTSPDQTVGWQTYKNDQYGFEFKYPANFSNIKTSNLSSAFKDAFGFPMTFVFSSDQIQAFIIDGALDSKKINQYNTSYQQDYMKGIKIDGRTAYEHSFTTALSYHSKVLQVPIDDTHYLEIHNSFKSGFPGEISSGDWSVLVSSIKFTAPVVSNSKAKLFLEQMQKDLGSLRERSLLRKKLHRFTTLRAAALRHIPPHRFTAR